MSKHIVIVGGVAAGASAAAKARRTSENVQVTILEAGPYISFANCGLPYYVGGEIADRGDLFVVNPAVFAKRFGIDVRLNATVTGIDTAGRTVTVEGDAGRETVLYDRLVLATGAEAIRPPIDGLDRPNIFTVRTVPDVDAITACLAHCHHPARETPGEVPGEQHCRAMVIGGGYIGLETAEQLARRGLSVTVVEMRPQLMPGALDVEMAQPLRDALDKLGVSVILDDAVSEVVERDGVTTAVTKAGREIPFEVGILSAGVRPNVALAKAAGITIGATGAVAVDDRQRTSDPAVYAAGDNSETRHLVLDRPVNLPLAGPANKAGRVAGANAALDLENAPDDHPARLSFRGVLGTAVVRIGETVAAMTGLTEAVAQREGISHKVLYIPASNHAGYYPGAERLMLKLLYAPADGKILGAQCVGGEGTDKRIDVLATAIAGGLTVDDLEQLDLCYAPPFGSAKDPVILAGFAAANERRGIMPTVTPAELLDELAGENPPVVIDVRSPAEYAKGHMDTAVNIPVDDIRDRIDDVPAGNPVAVHCGVGYRSYVAQQILMNHGRRNVRNITGGYMMIQQTKKALGK